MPHSDRQMRIEVKKMSIATNNVYALSIRAAHDSKESEVKLFNTNKLKPK